MRIRVCLPSMAQMTANVCESLTIKIIRLINTPQHYLFTNCSEKLEEIPVQQLLQHNRYALLHALRQ